MDWIIEHWWAFAPYVSPAYLIAVFKIVSEDTPA